MKTKSIILIMAVFAIGLSSCVNVNLPPDPGTPVPDPHNGVFVYESDTLVFNGDGKTVDWHFAQEIPNIGNDGQGTYVFLFGHGMCRYDVAETFRIIDTANDNKSYSFTIIGRASDTLITISRNDLDVIKTEAFLKISE